MMRSLAADEVITDDRGWAFNLAVFRIALLGGAVLPYAWHAFRWTERTMPGLPRDVWVPISFFAYLPRDVLADAQLAWWLAAANLVLVALALAGVFTRWTLAAATVLSLYVFGLLQNLGKVDHYHHLVWFMALAAVGPSARFLSVDAILGRGSDAPAGAALATLRCVWILLGLAYFFPGVAKLVSTLTGGWSSADSLRLVVWSQWFSRSLYQPDYTPPLWVDAVPSGLLTAGGLAVIAFEMGYVWLVLLRPVRALVAVAGLLFHAGSGVVLGIWFAFIVPAYAALIDWASLARRLGLPPRRDVALEPAVGVPSGTRWVGAVGAALIVAQTSVSALRLLAPAWPVPVWPFDIYPTFTRTYSPEATIWEARAVLTDGRELPLSARAWGRAFGPPARCMRIGESTLRAPDPERRARSREVAEVLWRHEAPEVRAVTEAVVVYEARYAIASVPRLSAATLLYRFPVDGLDLVPPQTRRR